MVFSLVGPTLTGCGAVVALVFGATELWSLLAAAALGALVAIPVAIGIARALDA
ncbi:hypothetical protein [Tropicimonas sp. S265A]|uniref:hypothetical protein n=1 Tax=Tropicimonas sp. S265A TaxID=3415134 RepID=UPI003C7C457B